jgi:hypothetical protein
MKTNKDNYSKRNFMIRLNPKKDAHKKAIDRLEIAKERSNITDFIIEAVNTYKAN